jgi:undecaprenyl-diphosphatase
MLQDINKDILIYLNSFTNNDIFKNIVLCFSDTPIFFLPIFLIWFWLYYTYNNQNVKKNNLLFIFYSIFIWIVISLTIQQFVVVSRPEDIINWTGLLLISHIPDASFPSDHATVSVAFLTSLFLSWYKKYWYIFSIFVILMLLSRVMAWVHWPLDILAWTIIWIWTSFFTFKFLIKKDFIKNLNNYIIKLASFFKL